MNLTELSHNAGTVLDKQVRAVYLNLKHYNKKVKITTVCLESSGGYWKIKNTISCGKK